MKYNCNSCFLLKDVFVAVNVDPDQTTVLGNSLIRVHNVCLFSEKNHWHYFYMWQMTSADVIVDVSYIDIVPYMSC